MGQIRGFSDHISVHLARGAPNALKSDLKKPRICPIWGLSDPLWSQTYHPCYIYWLTSASIEFPCTSFGQISSCKLEKKQPVTSSWCMQFLFKEKMQRWRCLSNLLQKNYPHTQYAHALHEYGYIQFVSLMTVINSEFASGYISIFTWQTCDSYWVLGWRAGMANLASKLGHIGPKWDKSGTF